MLLVNVVVRLQTFNCVSSENDDDKFEVKANFKIVIDWKKYD